MADTEMLKQRVEHIENELLMLYKSPMIGGEDLINVLGYKTNDAFRQAHVRNTLPVKVFAIKGRRGKFALVVDIAHWMATESLKMEVK
ncbi:MAG: hypothetical protein AAF988_06585 [Pseudomonadota bacterium]